MSSLQDIISLAKIDGGKFFVIDEKGEASLVIMGIQDYQKLVINKLEKQILDVENINKEILKAQLSETDDTIVEPEKPIRASFGPRVRQEPKFKQPDLRAEVIDPSFDFEEEKSQSEDF